MNVEHMQSLVLLAHFDVFPVATHLAYANNGLEAVNNISETFVGDTFAELSQSAYAVTGILNNAAGAPAVVPELLAAGGVYNSPAAMAQVVRDLERPEPQINIQPGAAGLLAMYPGEQARCTGVVGLGNINVAAGNYAPPGVNDTHVVCVATGGGGLHWVAQGSDGNFYDPGDGSVNNVWAPVNAGDAMGAYTFTGLWMVIN